ncbi:MAG TPA: hypothetical protein VG755_11300 [Nannocystaceae bacterium]|nr:hypothetical protein [Nannocystaceae bacterium]
MRLCPPVFGSIVAAIPALARGADEVEIVVTERVSEPQSDHRPAGSSAPPSGTTTRTVQVIERGPPTQRTTWLGLSVAAVTTPLSRRGALAYREQLGSDPLHACVNTDGQKWCTPLRGADVRLQIFATKGTWHYPRVIGYVRTGYEAGEAKLEPARAGGPRRGEATGVSYRSVPIFAGVSAYAFERFPVRPFVGAGMGVDVLQLRFARHEHAALLDLSPRFGVELHAGVEARIGNWVSINVELQQQWSVRRRLPGVPDFSDSRLAFVTGVAVAVPYATYSRRDPKAQHVTTSTRTVAPTVAPMPAQIRVGPPTTAPVYEVPPTPPRTIIIAPPSSATPPTPVSPAAGQ